MIIRAVWPSLPAMLLAAVMGGGLMAAQPPVVHPPILPPPPGHPKPLELPGLKNVFRFSEKLYNGSSPEGEEGFQSLARLGIRTIISVDGARPNVALARRHGMRYVHLPISYDGCPTPMAHRLARAVRDLPGPIYLHCHHGRHRSPTAAALVRITLDGISNAEAIKEMERAGTGKNYVGLYGDVRAFRPPSPEELDRVDPTFPEVAPTPPLVEAMTQIEQRFDNLLLCQKEGWRTPAKHPDLVPAHEALQLRELFAELERDPQTRRRPADYVRWMRDSEADARALEAALRQNNHSRAERLLQRIAVTCGSCHAKYRNVPRPR